MAGVANLRCQPTWSVMSALESVKHTFQKFVRWWSIHPQLTALAVGQCLSILITGTGVLSQLLATKYNVNMPTAQSSLNYILLAIVYGTVYFRKVSIWETVKTKWFLYFPLAFVDVEANYFGAYANG